MKKTLVLFVALILGLTFLLTGCSKDKDPNTLVLGMDDAFPPMGFRDDSGNLVGFDLDVAAEVCKRLNMTLKIQPIDWKMKQQELDAGNVDCLWNGYTVTEERARDCALTEPYMKNRQIFVVRKDSAATTLDDFAGKKLALQAGSSAEDALNGAPDFKADLADVLLLKTNTQALMDLKASGCDVVLMDEVVAKYYVTTDSSVKTLDLSLADEEYAIGFRKGDTALRDKVQNTLREMADDGTLAEISRKWFGEDITIIK